MGVLLDFEGEKAHQVCSFMWADNFWILSWQRDEAIRGKRVTGTPNMNMMERWQCHKKRATLIHLELITCEVRARKMCVCARASRCGVYRLCTYWKMTPLFGLGSKSHFLASSMRPRSICSKFLFGVRPSALTATRSDPCGVECLAAWPVRLHTQVMRPTSVSTPTMSTRRLTSPTATRISSAIATPPQSPPQRTSKDFSIREHPAAACSPRQAEFTRCWDH